MAGWRDMPDGTRQWVNDDGTINPNMRPFSPQVPFGQSPGRHGNLFESIGNFVADNVGSWAHNAFQVAPENMGNTIGNFVMGQRGLPAGPPPPAPPEPHFGPVSGLDINPEDFGVGGSPATVSLPDAPTIEAPPARTVDPALAAREQYMAGREGRVRGIYDEYLHGLESDDPSRQPWWRRLAGVAGVVAATGDLSRAGEAASEYFGNEAQYRQAVRDAVMRMGLAGEDLGMDTENARLSSISGQHAAEEGTAQDQYQTRVANAENQDTRHVAQVQEGNQNARASWQVNQQIAAQRFAQAMAELRQAQATVAAGGGAAGLGATESMFGRLPENMQVAATEQQAQRGLVNIITQAREPDRIHYAMEGLAGHSLPRMPNMNQASPDQIAQWYVQHGVNLASPGVVNAFPGFGQPGG